MSWEDHCPGCGEKHMFRDCPNHITMLHGSKYVTERLASLEEETMMEKHGVVKDDSKTKTASTAQGKCPSCGSELTKEGDSHIDHCPKCGTKPFEQTPEGE